MIQKKRSEMTENLKKKVQGFILYWRVLNKMYKIKIKPTLTLETLRWNTRIVCSLQNFKIVFSLILGWFSVLRLSNKYLMLTVSFFVYVLRLKANNNNPMIVKNALNSLNSLTSDLNSMKECKIANDDLFFCLVYT